MEAQSLGTRKQFSPRSCPGQRAVPLLLFFLFLFVSSAWAQTRLTVEWQGERLSVTAARVPLSQILQEIAHRTDIELRMGEGLGEEVSVRFSHLSLLEGLRKLLADVSYIIIEKPVPQGQRQPVRALVFGQRTRSLPQEIVSEEGEKLDDKLAAGDEEERLRALQALALEGNEEAVRKALSDPNPTIQALALDLLAERNQQEAIPLLVNGTKSPQPEVRLRALDLLTNSQADKPTILAALSEAVADEDMQVKSYALRTLAAWDGPEAVEYLRRALHDPSSSVRLLAIDYIVSSLPLAHRNTLLQEVVLDEDEGVRAAASSWLEEAGSVEK